MRLPRGRDINGVNAKREDLAVVRRAERGYAALFFDERRRFFNAVRVLVANGDNVDVVKAKDDVAHHRVPAFAKADDSEFYFFHVFLPRFEILT